MKPQNYSGVLLIDGKAIPVKQLEEETLEMRHQGGFISRSAKRRKIKKNLTLLPFIDYETHDIPVYIIASSENKYEIREGFRELKEMGYELKVLICDESVGEIAQVAKEFYPQVITQTCLKHYSANLDREFKVNGIKRTIRSIENKLESIGESLLIPTHRHDIERARKLTNRLADLEFKYRDLIRFQNAMNDMLWGSKTLEELGEAEDRMNELLAQMNLDQQHGGRIIKRYRDYYKKHIKITAFLRYPDLNIPKTTNLIEGFNSTGIELRLSSIRGFEKEETARNYVNAMILKYRFHKFKCCKKPFTHLNGKSPLEIAHPSIHKNLPSGREWIEFCRKLKVRNPPKKEGG
jgi:uncharacterized protein YaaR (DUF327 family)